MHHLLKIPDVAFQVIMQCMEPIEILFLSMCSKTAMKKVALSSYNHSAELCIVNLNSEDLQFQIFHPTYNFCFSWTFISHTQKHSNLTNIVSSNVSGLRIKANLGKHSHVFCDSPSKAFMTVLSHSLEIFRAPLDICIMPNTPDLQEILSLPCFAYCKKLFIHKGLKCSKFKTNELKVIFDKIHSFENLTIESETSFRLEAIFNAKFFKISNALWMNSNDLCRIIDCEQADIQKHSFLAKDIEHLIRDWMTRKETPDAQRFSFAWPNDEILEFGHLKKTSWNPKKRSKCCLKQTGEQCIYNFENAIDFERSDGTIASVITVDAFLIFHVWHIPFPMKKEEDTLKILIARLYEQFPGINQNYGSGNALEDMLLNKHLSVVDFETFKLELVTIREEEVDSSLRQWLSFANHLNNARKELFMLANVLF